jgi:hypothetical protein
MLNFHTHLSVKGSPETVSHAKAAFHIGRAHHGSRTNHSEEYKNTLIERTKRLNIAVNKEQTTRPRRIQRLVMEETRD